MPTNISVATINVNGVRAAAKKGLIEWIVEHSPDIIALQEVRAETSDLEEIFKAIEKLDGKFSLRKSELGGLAIVAELPNA